MKSRATRNRRSMMKLARERAGLSVIDAAARAGVSPGYLRQVERWPLGGAPCSYALGKRLSRIYGCSASVFLTLMGEQSR